MRQRTSGVGAAQLERAFVEDVARSGGRRGHAGILESDVSRKSRLVDGAHARPEVGIEHLRLRLPIDVRSFFSKSDAALKVRARQNRRWSSPRVAQQVLRGNRPRRDALLGREHELHPVVCRQARRRRSIVGQSQFDEVCTDLTAAVRLLSAAS